jgi:hypothetical protein
LIAFFGIFIFIGFEDKRFPSALIVGANSVNFAELISAILVRAGDCDQPLADNINSIDKKIRLRAIECLLIGNRIKNYCPIITNAPQ